jgi:hypothetical protein
MRKPRRARPKPRTKSRPNRRRRRTKGDLWHLALRLAAACAKKAGGLGARSLGKALRASPRSIRPALGLAVAEGLLRRSGVGRAALYFPAQVAATGPLDGLADRSTGELSRLLGVDRRTLLRWRRGGHIPSFHKLRIEALLGAER